MFCIYIYSIYNYFFILLPINLKLGSSFLFLYLSYFYSFCS